MTISPLHQDRGPDLILDANGDLHYSVVGRWPFPSQMLESDQSEPATLEDAAKIDSLTRENAPDRGFMHDDHTINLVIRDAGRRRPNAARWESFQWSVPGDVAFRWSKQMECEETQRAELVKSAMSKLSAREVEALQWHGLKLDPV